MFVRRFYHRSLSPLLLGCDTHPDGPLWTFWDYKYERWPKDKSLRLDHFLLSPKVSDRLVDGAVDRWVRGQANASDHAPTWIMLDH